MAADISGAAGDEDWDFAHERALAKPHAEFQPGDAREVATEVERPGNARDLVHSLSREESQMRRFFANLASRGAYLMGHPAAFIIAVLACVIWAVSGPLFHYSDTWQLVINTATTVLTFLAVFLIQNSQNRDGAAIQAKLDEILISVHQARSELVGIENLTDAELTALKTALEREVHAPHETDPDVPTVEEILENRDKD
jgi:low affinity Fe/Cu permease